MLKINSAEYIASYPNFANIPPESLPEIAFLGRSNVGKSSLINFICRRKNLAKTSSTPGKTRSLNYFLINDAWFLVDFPGYGYAKVARKERQYWQRNLQEYLQKRRSLVLVCLLIDASIASQLSDLSMLADLLYLRVNCALIFTKIDKVKNSVAENNISNFLKQVVPTPNFVQVSVKQGRGQAELLTLLEQNLA